MGDTERLEAMGVTWRHGGPLKLAIPAGGPCAHCQSRASWPTPCSTHLVLPLRADGDDHPASWLELAHQVVRQVLRGCEAGGRCSV